MSDKHKLIPPAAWQAIERATALIARHPNVVRVSNLQPDDGTGNIEITADIRLGLPTPWMAAGRSPNGVRAIEPVNFAFPSDYPLRAPVVTLREDFDRALAHVQPGPPDGPVVPCLIAGDLNELLHAHGLLVIVNQVVAWLEKAALGTLIDPSQGWEPIRRDGLVDWIVADGDFLRRLVGKQETYHFFVFSYLKFVPSVPSDYARKDFVLYGEVGTDQVPVNQKRYPDLFHRQASRGGVMRGWSFAMVVTPGKLPSGELYIAGTYTPETVTNFRELQERAEAYGCGNSLKNAVSYLSRCARQWQGPTAPVAVILCARRPYPLIGESSNIELVPYLVEIQAPELFPAGDQTPVYPAAHRHAITSTLLQRFSGEAPVPEERTLTLVGCGSLGSKIAMHLARSGAAPAMVIDKHSLSPHNAARHALLPPAHDLQLTWLGSKAEALAAAIGGLGQSVKAFDADVTRATHDDKVRRRLCSKRTWAVLNTTASLRVREALACIAPDRLRARIIETALFANGTVGLVTVEGPNRNPNSMDLIAAAYELFRTDERWRDVVFAPEDALQWQSVGQGCGSATMRVSDARISLFAASMAEGITRIRLQGLSEDGGRILRGSVDNDGMSLHWAVTVVPPVHLVKPDNAPSWIVRVAEVAHQKILSACAEHPHVETGGIIVGRISESQRAFLVTDVLPAPEDSHRSATGFVLGTQGVRDRLEAYATSCGYALYCLGTWHRHLNTSGPSGRDQETATHLAMARIVPSLLVIKTAAGYRAWLATR